MIDQIGKRVGPSVPAAAHQMLVQFKDVSWHAMNSFVHGGIHPLRLMSRASRFTCSPDPCAIPMAAHNDRHDAGNPDRDEAVAKPMSKVQPAFADCLPDLLK